MTDKSSSADSSFNFLSISSVDLGREAKAEGEMPGEMARAIPNTDRHRNVLAIIVIPPSCSVSSAVKDISSITASRSSRGRYRSNERSICPVVFPQRISFPYREADSRLPDRARLPSHLCAYAWLEPDRRKGPCRRRKVSVSPRDIRHYRSLHRSAARKSLTAARPRVPPLAIYRRRDRRHSHRIRQCPSFCRSARS